MLRRRRRREERSKGSKKWARSSRRRRNGRERRKKPGESLRSTGLEKRRLQKHPAFIAVIYGEDASVAVKIVLPKIVKYVHQI